MPISRNRLHDVARLMEIPNTNMFWNCWPQWTRSICNPLRAGRAFIFRAITRQIYTQIGAAFGISMQFDQNLTSRIIRF